MSVYAVELKNITKTYKNKQIMDNVNITIKKGETVCITGKSGVGKSTLLNLIGLIDKQSSGEVYIHGKMIKNINSAQAMQIRRRSIDYLFQNFALIDEETVEENLVMALTFQKNTLKRKKENIKKSLISVGLHGFEHKKVFTLSGGEQQRVAIARAMIRNNSILLADEPTGSLDGDTRDTILDILNVFKNDKEKTVIIVSHDPIVAKWCDRIIMIE